MVLEEDEMSAKESDIKSATEQLRVEKRYDLIVLLITNPRETGEKCIVKDEQRLIEKAFSSEIKDEKGSIPQTISRKKGCIPKIGHSCTTS
jgi:inorganic pyrophosphatase/exopolyphosphatase